MARTNDFITPTNEQDSSIRDLRRLPLTALRIFEAAGRTGSFVAAAEEVDLSPSAVSHAIKKLEDAAGLKLFTRTTRALTLTDEGRLLLEYVQRGFEEMHRGFRRVLPEAAVVPLRLHTAPTFATQWLMPRLARFVAENPGINLRFSADTKYANFDNDDYDIDVVYGDPGPSRHEKIPLVIEELTPLCSPEMARNIRSVQDLYSNPLIQSDGQSVQWKGWFSANNLMPPREYFLAFDRSAMVIAAAVEGLGVVLESSLLAERELAAGKLVAPLRDTTTSVRYVGHYLVHPRTHHQHAALTRFKQWLLHELAQPATLAE
jgi:LysR family glycine cleavage system transcriptional activator